MRRLLAALGIVLAACGTAAPGGTLGLPSAGPAASTAAPTPRTPGASASPSPSASATGTPTPLPPTTSSTPTPTPTPRPAPAIIAATATQVSLTVVYSEPMRTALACGTTGRAAGVAGAIDDWSTLHYDASDPVFDESIASTTEVTVTADCTAVTFLFGLAAAPGTFDVTATRVESLGGSRVDPARATARVTIADQGRPRAARVEGSADTILVTFTEPMLRMGEGGGVTTPTNYRLDGNTTPILSIACPDQGCRSARISLRPGTLVPGRRHELRIANVVDRAGLNLTPDPTTLVFTAGS